MSFFKKDPGFFRNFYTTFDDGFLFQTPYSFAPDSKGINCSKKFINSKLFNTHEKQQRVLKEADTCKIPLKDRVSPDYEPRCRPWYTIAINNPGVTIGLPPYIDADSRSTVTTFTKALTVQNTFLKKSMTFVTSVDLDLDNSTFGQALNTLNGVDHFFLLDMNANVFIHSWVSSINKENIPIENFEYGNRSDA